MIRLAFCLPLVYSRSMTTKTAKAAETAAPLWTDMTPGLFDTAAKPVQGALFAEPDKCGTPDMFAEIEETAAPAGPVPTPGYSVRLMIYFAMQGERRVAYSWSPFGRAIRVPLADALIWQATDAADVLPGHPLKP